MNLFNKTMGSFNPGSGLEDIRPVGSSDPSVGFSSRLAKQDHKHRLEVPNGVTFSPGVTSNGVTTNITSTGTYWIDQHLWVEFEINITFTGAPGAGTYIEFTLPFPVVSSIVVASGLATMVDTGVNTYIGDVYLIPTGSGLLGSVLLRASPVTQWTYNSPWTIGNGDVAIIKGRYRRNPNL